VGWGFRKSFKIAPGVRINVSRRGVSTSFGGKGVTVNSRGRVTTSISGTGISHTASLRSGKKYPSQTYINTEGTDMAQGKRAVENESFALNLQSRRHKAISSYFLSHGILSAPEHLGDAIAIDRHIDIFSQVQEELASTTEALRLLDDIGSISLSAKEKAMKALYKVENSLSSAHGPVRGISEGLASLSVATQSIPQKPKYWAYILWTLILSMLSIQASFFGAVALVVAGVGIFKRMQYQKKMTEASRAIAKANATLDALIKHEVTPRAFFLN
jgi:hypothetical protein